MKKVLFVISYLVEGGAERALSNITTHFPPEWQIDILVNDDTVVDYPYKGTVLTLGVTGKKKTSSVLFQFWVFLRRVRKLRDLKKNGNYQACVSFMDSANIANILSGKSFCKVVVSVRNSLVHKEKLPQYRYVVNPLVRLLYNYADKIVAVSRGVEEELQEFFHLKPEKLTVIENGYNVIDIQQQAKEDLTEEERGLLKDKVVIATVGRLTEQKGQWHLIRAFTEVVKKVPNAFLVIIGSGGLESYLRQLCQKCKMEEYIYFTGHVANPFKYLNCSDVFVLPSLYEGFPNALAEAVCMGLPCVATDFRTGAREILAPDMVRMKEPVRAVQEVRYGILTPMCSGKMYRDYNTTLEQAEQYMAEAIEKILVSKEKHDEYRQKSKQRRETLGIDSVVNKWIDVIESV